MSTTYDLLYKNNDPDISNHPAKRGSSMDHNFFDSQSRVSSSQNLISSPPSAKRHPQTEISPSVFKSQDNFTRNYYSRYIKNINHLETHQKAARKAQFIPEDEIKDKTYADRFQIYLKKLVKE